MPFQSLSTAGSKTQRIQPSSTARLGIVIWLTVLASACGSTTPIGEPAAATPTSASPFEPAPSIDSEPTPSSPAEVSESTEPGTALAEIPVGTAGLNTEPPETTDAPEEIDTPGTPPTSGVPDAPTSPIVENLPPPVCAAEPLRVQEYMLKMINEARATARFCGDDEYAAARALSWNTTLEDTARAHSADMASINFFSHTGSDGSSVSDRVTRAGYTWSTVGENIAAGQSNAANALSGWLNSPGHCRNIMNPAFREVAVACVNDDGADYRRYWTNVLAAPR